MLTFGSMYCIIPKSYGGVAQLARAFGSYPKGQWFESTHRHQIMFWWQAGAKRQGKTSPSSTKKKATTGIEAKTNDKLSEREIFVK